MKKCLLLSGILAVFLDWGCEKRFALHDTLPLNDTVEIANFETRYNHTEKIRLRMDSVLSDSRCPSNVDCFWEGNAQVRFFFRADSILTEFVLNTHGGNPFRSDTVISGYEIQLLGLSPYPEDPGEILQMEYVSKIMVKAVPESP
jgi:hypothetical protein